MCTDVHSRCAGHRDPGQGADLEHLQQVREAQMSLVPASGPFLSRPVRAAGAEQSVRGSERSALPTALLSLSRFSSSSSPSAPFLSFQK